MLLYKLGKYLDTSRGIRAGVSTYRRNDDNAVPTGIKVCGSYVNSALAKTESVKNGFDEAILLNSRGSVAEGSGENIFLVKNGKIITPDLSQHILPGLTRSAILSIARQEGTADIEERQVARGEQVDYVAQYTNLGVPYYTYEWSAPENQKSMEIIPRFVFKNAGEKVVRTKIQDAAGSQIEITCEPLQVI